MGKAGQRKDPNARQPGETYWQHQSRLARQRQEERDKAQPIVPPEAMQHGSYERRFVTNVETNTKADTVVNRGGDPISRWEAAGRLSGNQMVAIAHMQRIWRLAGLEQRVTANYGERIGGMGSSERVCLSEIEARQDLHRIRGEYPDAYFNVFENVCRFGHAAGNAGQALGYGSRSAETRAHQIVCMLADMIFDRERL